MGIGRLRQHTNPLTLANLEPRGSRLELPADREVEVEIGCGDARFLVERALVRPEAHLVGVEIRREFVELARERAAAAGVTVELVVTNVNVDLCTLFAEASMSRAFVNFPDPWFKRRHQKR